MKADADIEIPKECLFQYRVVKGSHMLSVHLATIIHTPSAGRVTVAQFLTPVPVKVKLRVTNPVLVYLI